MPPIRERELIKPPVGHLLVLFIAVPVVELALLIEIGQRVGTVGTIGLIMGTGIVDGVLILVAAAVLITPGVLTDLAGFLCLVPACRRLLKRYLHQRFEGTMRRGGAGVRGAFVSAGEPSRRSRMKNVTPRRPTDPGR